MGSQSHFYASPTGDRYYNTSTQAQPISSGNGDCFRRHFPALSCEHGAELQGRPPPHFQKKKSRQAEGQTRSQWQGQERKGKTRTKVTGK